MRQIAPRQHIFGVDASPRFTNDKRAARKYAAMCCFLLYADLKFQRPIWQRAHDSYGKPVVGVNQPASIARRVRDHCEPGLVSLFGRRPSGDA